MLYNSNFSAAMDQNDVSGTDSATDGLLARVHTIQMGDDGNLEVSGQAVDLSKDLHYGIQGARWIHIPVNDLSWVEVSISDSLAPA